MPSEPPALSIVVPAFNEAARIAETLTTLREHFARSEESVELIVVDDGSTDATAGIVRAFDATPLSLLLLKSEPNYGKGHAVRVGVAASLGELVAFCDADLSTPIDEITRLRHWLGRGYDVAIGSRDLPDAWLDPPQPLLRRWLAWLFRALRRRILLPELRDTQCGFKLFRGDLAREIFALSAEEGWLFDCEVLEIARRRGARIKEIGVKWRNRSPSRVNALRDAAPSLLGLFRLRRRIAAMKENEAGGKK